MKYGWKGILSVAEFSPVGLLEPVSCKKSRCRSMVAKVMKGNRKCREKNRVRVALSTAKPPQTQVTSVGPRWGMAESMFVITVAPQKDICPHGST